MFITDYGNLFGLTGEVEQDNWGSSQYPECSSRDLCKRWKYCQEICLLKRQQKF